MRRPRWHISDFVRRNRALFITIGLSVLFPFFVETPTVHATTYYVAPTGNDATFRIGLITFQDHSKRDTSTSCKRYAVHSRRHLYGTNQQQFPNYPFRKFMVECSNYLRLFRRDGGLAASGRRPKWSISRALLSSTLFSVTWCWMEPIFNAPARVDMGVVMASVGTVELITSGSPTSRLKTLPDPEFFSRVAVRMAFRLLNS